MSTIKVSVAPRFTKEQLFSMLVPSGSTSPKYVGDSHIVSGMHRMVGNVASRSYGAEIELPVDDYSKTLRTHGDYRELFNDLPVGRKTDGTIGDGIEFTFPPMTRRQIREKGGVYDQFFARYAQVKGKANGRDHGTHIHVPANTIEAGACMAIHALAQTNAKLFRWFAGRQGYDGYVSSNTSVTDIMMLATSSLLNRYLIGFNQVGTVEFRIFDAVDTVEHLDAIMEFVACTVAWSRTKAARSIIIEALAVGSTGTKEDIATLVDTPVARTTRNGVNQNPFYSTTSAESRLHSRILSVPGWGGNVNRYHSDGTPLTQEQKNAVRQALDKLTESFRKFIARNASRFPQVAGGLEYFDSEVAPINNLSNAEYRGPRSYRNYVDCRNALIKETVANAQQSSTTPAAPAAA